MRSSSRGERRNRQRHVSLPPSRAPRRGRRDEKKRQQGKDAGGGSEGKEGDGDSEGMQEKYRYHKRDIGSSPRRGRARVYTRAVASMCEGEGGKRRERKTERSREENREGSVARSG